MSRTLAEDESGALLAEYGVPVAGAVRVDGPDGAVDAAEAIGYPVVAKLVGDAIAHKTERGLVRLGLADASAVRHAAADLLAAARPADGAVAVLVAPMLRGTRELVAGLARDPQFGPCVMIGFGGVLTEAVG
ncbi:MAG: acetate--CoA ligase family protein, partial [Actinomycetota bacterium]